MENRALADPIPPCNFQTQSSDPLYLYRDSQ